MNIVSVAEYWNAAWEYTQALEAGKPEAELKILGERAIRFWKHYPDLSLPACLYRWKDPPVTLTLPNGMTLELE